MKCATCQQEIRPVAEGDGIDPADWDYYRWVDETGNPVCGFDEEQRTDLLHEPEPDDHRA